MARWTGAHGKDDQKNPFSFQNHYSAADQVAVRAGIAKRSSNHLHRDIELHLKAASTSKLPPEAKKPPMPGLLQQIYPFIEAVIQEHSLQMATYMRHQQMVDALLKHNDAALILKNRALQTGSNGQRWSPQQFASNCIAFYGKDWTDKRPGHADSIERQRVEGRWAYREVIPYTRLQAATEKPPTSLDSGSLNNNLVRGESQGQIGSSDDISQKPRRAISIRQPYAEQILRGLKVREYRSVRTHIRGRVYIYASLHPGAKSQFEALGLGPTDLPRGFLVGSVEIIGCKWLAKRDCYAYVLANPRRLRKKLKPIKHPQPIWFYPF